MGIITFGTIDAVRLTVALTCNFNYLDAKTLIFFMDDYIMTTQAEKFIQQKLHWYQ